MKLTMDFSLFYFLSVALKGTARHSEGSIVRKFYGSFLRTFTDVDSISTLIFISTIKSKVTVRARVTARVSENACCSITYTFGLSNLRFIDTQSYERASTVSKTSLYTGWSKKRIPSFIFGITLVIQH